MSTLTHSPADVLRHLLIAMSYGTDQSTYQPWPVIVSNEPDTPDNCLTVYDSIDVLNGRYQWNGEYCRHRGMSLRIRSVDHPTGYAKADVIYNGLAGSVYDTAVVIGANRYVVHAITLKGGILDNGRDVQNSQRHLFTIDFTTTLKQTQ